MNLKCPVWALIKSILFDCFCFVYPHSQIEAEFARLTSVDLKGSFFAGLDQYLARFLELYKAKSGIADLTRLMRCLDEDVSVKKCFSSSMHPTFVVSKVKKLPSWSAVQIHTRANSFFYVGLLFFFNLRPVQSLSWMKIYSSSPLSPIVQIEA